VVGREGAKLGSTINGTNGRVRDGCRSWNRSCGRSRVCGGSVNWLGVLI
jgi:hypothetical protein